MTVAVPSWTSKNGRLNAFWDSCRLYADGEEVALTRTEWRVFKCFVGNPGRLIMSEDLARGLNMEIRLPKWHISNMRKKIGSAFELRTRHGFGYIYDG